MTLRNSPKSDSHRQPIGKGLLTHKTIPLTLQIGVLHFEMTSLYVITSPKNPLILGFPWLQQHDPQINWKRGELARWSPFCMAHCLKSVFTRPCLATSIESLSPVDDVYIPMEYWRLCEAYGKEKATQLPPHHLWDCAINVLPNAMSLKCKIYPLSLPESHAMDEYIEEAFTAGLHQTIYLTCGSWLLLC
ncbi:hypothetical protein QTP86_005005 [Hemibagrus guttatus]|nr:hypothetical protein QTP86_005005 [Hemibagrus guttatus]